VKKRTSCLATLAVILGITSFDISSASAQNKIQIFGAERLASAQNWSESDSIFTPSTSDHNASVIFPANKWSALIGTLPLKAMGGTFSIHLRCRWHGDLTTIKGTNAVIMFEDEDGKDMPGAISSPVPATADWQEVTVSSAIPKGAVQVRFDLDSTGGGPLEISDYDLYLQDTDLTTDAVTGTVMPWLTVPGGKAALPPQDPASASATFTASDPYSFDAPVWSTVAAHDIPTTTTNKTPLNDVAANFQMVWTADNLYVRYHAHDPILNFKARSRYERDCFEFFMQPTGGSHDAAALISKEQYTITRTPEGKTDANVDAITRVVSDGWEAIAKIPLQTEDRRIYPFNGLQTTFNAVYQDCDTLPQEHWLSFSKKDQTNSSWENTSLYVPLVFETDTAMAYKPMWLGGANDAYNVEPKFTGMINLVHSSATLANLDMWDKSPECHIDAYTDGGHNCFRFKFPANPRQRRVLFDMSPMNVLAGETLDITMDVRSDAGPTIPTPSVAFLSESSWNITGSSTTTAGPLGQQWIKVSFRMTMPDTSRGSIRNGRMLFTVGTIPGRTVEIRDIKVTRRLPANFDALISVPGQYSHFWNGAANTLNFHLVSGIPTQAKVTAVVINYFTGKTLMSQQWTKDMTAGGEATTTWDVSKLPDGFFNVLLKVRDANGGFLADRELYVSKSIKNTRMNPFSGMFISNDYDVTAPANIPARIAMLQGMGEGRAQWADFYLFDSEGKDLPGDRLALLKAYHNAGFETGWTIPQGGTHDIGRNWQPDELTSFYDRFMTKTRGLFSHFSFSNEPNLYGGWFPEPDAREWAIYNREFYNAVKRDAPTTKPILGSFNDIPEDYVKAAADENNNSFADGVMGFHLYGLETNGAGFVDDLKVRQQLDKIHPGWEAWDTESGSVFYNFDGILDLQSKKMPIELCAGYTSSIFLDGYTYTFPDADSNPLVPMEAYKNYFYLDCKPVGRVMSSDGKTAIYLFRHSDGQGYASFWNTSHDASSAVLPVIGHGVVLDVFGNQIQTLKQGSNSIALNDRFLRYVKGLDLKTLMKDPSFIAAFKSSATKPSTDAGYTTHVFVSLPEASKAFDRQMPIGQQSELSISLHNDGATVRTLKLGTNLPAGLTIAYNGSASVVLKPGQTKVVAATIIAAKAMDKAPFSITGVLDDGLKIVPTLFTVSTTPPIDVRGYTRSIEIANNSTTAAEIDVVATKPELVFQPGVLKENLDPSKSVTGAFQILPNGNYNSNFNIMNVPIFYAMAVTAPTGTYSKDGVCTIFSPGQDYSGPVDFANLPYTANTDHPGAEPFQADYNLAWTTKGLRIVARVHDVSPLQSGIDGYLKAGGDCMVVAFDPNDGASPNTFGANYVECGFAYSHGGPTSYNWNGHFGLEAATAFPESVNSITRDANYIYYDVTIPSKVYANTNGGVNAGMSISFVNKGADGSTQTIDLGEGIFPVRDPARMGLLLSPR